MAPRWIQEIPTCFDCRRVSVCTLRGDRNESYGHFCKRCADKRLKAANKERAAVAKETQR